MAVLEGCVVNVGAGDRVLCSDSLLFTSVIFICIKLTTLHHMFL